MNELTHALTKFVVYAILMLCFFFSTIYVLYLRKKACITGNKRQKIGMTFLYIGSIITSYAILYFIENVVVNMNLALCELYLLFVTVSNTFGYKHISGIAEDIHNKSQKS